MISALRFLGDCAPRNNSIHRARVLSVLRQHQRGELNARTRDKRWKARFFTLRLGERGRSNVGRRYSSSNPQTGSSGAKAAAAREETTAREFESLWRERM